MSKMIQIRDVPDEIHRVLKTRATQEGMSLSDFLKRELERTAGRPTMQEWLEQTSKIKPLTSNLRAVQVIRKLRDNS